MIHFKHIYYFAFICLSLLLYRCTPKDIIVDNHLGDKKYYLIARPPGVVKIANNLFYDQTEITNTDWREYLYWTQHTFGTNSIEYKSSLPDTNVWIDSTLLKNTIYYLKPFVEYYLRGVPYIDYPVVGISQKQAIDFSKWRADRVMEGILILHKKFDWDSAPNNETYFTIEKYFTGKYKNIKPDTNFVYYPNYRLPTIVEWKMAMHYADSIDKTTCKGNTPMFRADIDPIINDTLYKNAPTENVFTGCISKDKLPVYQDNSPIYNLRGNVGEWTSEGGITIGGGWADKRQIILTQDTFHLKTQNAWTGFRNVCEWKRWIK